MADSWSERNKKTTRRHPSTSSANALFVFLSSAHHSLNLKHFKGSKENQLRLLVVVVKKDAIVKMSIYTVFSSFSKQDFRLLYHKCALLQSQDRVDEFVEAGIELFKLFFNDVYHNKDLMGRPSPLWCSVLLCFSFYFSSLLPSLPPFLPPPSLPSLLPPSLPPFLFFLPSFLPSCLPPSLPCFLPSSYLENCLRDGNFLSMVRKKKAGYLG